MLDADLRLWLCDDLLMKMDKMSMAASVEARVPLLDNPLVDWAMRLAPRHKIRGLEGKVLLKRLARKLLPAEVVDRPKVGFTVPLSPWFRGPLRELLADTLLSPACLARGYFETAVLRGYVDDHLAGPPRPQPRAVDAADARAVAPAVDRPRARAAHPVDAARPRRRGSPGVSGPHPQPARPAA